MFGSGPLNVDVLVIGIRIEFNNISRIFITCYRNGIVKSLLCDRVYIHKVSLECIGIRSKQQSALYNGEAKCGES